MDQWINNLINDIQWLNSETINYQWCPIYDSSVIGMPGLSTRCISNISTIVCPNIWTVDIQAKNVTTSIII